ncbi:MAG: hypothetical protein ACE5R6_07675 [Candidatus Heimdallarchaeota archaeon]
MIKNGFVVTRDASDKLVPEGAIYIEDSKIIDIGKTRDLDKTYKAE